MAIASIHSGLSWYNSPTYFHIEQYLGKTMFEQIMYDWKIRKGIYKQ